MFHGMLSISAQQSTALNCVLQDKSTCSISWRQKFRELVTLRGQFGAGDRYGKCEPFGSRAKAEFENNDRRCDIVKTLQRKETWTKRIWERSPAGIGDHIVEHLIWVFGGTKKKKTTSAGLWGQRRGERGGNRPRDKETDDNPKKKPCLSKQMAAG